MKILRIRGLILAAILAVLLGVAGWAAEQPLVSNVFENTYLIDALRDVSAQTGVPIVADFTVTGQITLTLENVPLEEALARMLASGGYVFRNMGGYYLVGAPDIKNPSFVLLSNTEVIKLRYAKAAAAAKAMADIFTPFIKVDPDNNTIIITAPQTILERIKADLALIDRAVPQIMIEALVVDVSKEGRKDLGLDWRWDHADTSTPGLAGTGAISFVDLALGLTYTAPGGLNKFFLSLQATVENGEARIEANPRVMTLDGQAAEIFVGRDRYYQLTSTTDDSTTTTLEAIKTGITLKLLPQVAENGEITVRVEPEVSDVVTDGTAGGSLPVINRRKVSTIVRVMDGQSIVLGGLIQRSTHQVKTKTPGLGDIPLLGHLFSRTEDVQEESEILIIITPRLVREAGVTPGSIPLPGQESK